MKKIKQEPAPWMLALFKRRPDIAKMAYHGLQKRALLMKHFGGEENEENT